MSIKDAFFYIGRVLLKILADTYYSSIIIENEEFVPENGIPTFICCNHPNSLTDAASNNNFYIRNKKIFV